MISSEEGDDGQAVPGSDKQVRPETMTCIAPSPLTPETVTRPCCPATQIDGKAAGSQEVRAGRGTPSRHAGSAARKRLADWEEEDSGGSSGQEDNESDYEQSEQD